MYGKGALLRVGPLYLLTYSSIFGLSCGRVPGLLGFIGFLGWVLNVHISVCGLDAGAASTFCGRWRQIVLLVWGFHCHSGDMVSVCSRSAGGFSTAAPAKRF